MSMIPRTITPGAPVFLIRDPERRGTVSHIYDDGRLHVIFRDGFTELCQPEELELN